MNTLFISYRRETGAGEARALFGALGARLGKNSVFMDVDSIALGRDFRTALHEMLESCDVVLVLIDKHWTDIKDQDGRLRLAKPDDYVRMEVSAALKRDIVVTPILVGGARMPTPDQLPEDIRDLVYRNSFELTHERWESDVEAMLKRLGLYGGMRRVFDFVTGHAAEIATRSAVAMFFAIFALGLFFFDPLHLDAAKTGSLDNWFQRYYASDYPSNADERLAVVLIDEPTLEEWKADWPVPYDYLVGIIYRLSCARATAAFFDLIPVSQYSDLEGQDRLAMAVADSSQIDQPCPDASLPERIPVFFGGSEPEKSRLLIEMASGRGHLFNLETNVEPGIYPVGRETFPNRPVRDDEITPAFGLLRRLCEAGSVNSSAPLDCNVRQALSSNRPLVVRWSGRVAPEQNDIYPTEACLQTPGFWGQLLFSLYWRGGAGGYQPCRPILTIPANALISGNIRTARPGRDPVLDLMKGRIVMIGVDLPLLNDVVSSPVHGTLPGVFVHAMALSNLLTYGDAYPTRPDDPGLLLVLVPLFLLLEFLRRFSPELFNGTKVLGNKDKTGSLYQDLLLISVSLALVLIFATAPNLLFGASWSLQFVLFVLIFKVLIYYYSVPVTEFVRLLIVRLARMVDRKAS